MQMFIQKMNGIHFIVIICSLVARSSLVIMDPENWTEC